MYRLYLWGRSHPPDLPGARPVENELTLLTLSVLAGAFDLEAAGSWVVELELGEEGVGSLVLPARFEFQGSALFGPDRRGRQPPGPGQ